MDNPEPYERTAPAADADVLGDEARNTGKLDKLTDDTAQRRDGGDEGSARPGADENQAGFVKDPDKKFGP